VSSFSCPRSRKGRGNQAIRTVFVAALFLQQDDHVDVDERYFHEDDSDDEDPQHDDGRHEQDYEHFEEECDTSFGRSAVAFWALMLVQTAEFVNLR